MSSDPNADRLASYPAPTGNDTLHISYAFPEVIRELAKRHEISEQEVIDRMRGKVITPDDQ